jgi:hypothetical protein
MMIATEGFRVGSGITRGRKGVYMWGAGNFGASGFYMVHAKLLAEKPLLFGAVVEVLVDRAHPHAHTVNKQWVHEEKEGVHVIALHFCITAIKDLFEKPVGQINIAVQDVSPEMQKRWAEKCKLWMMSKTPEPRTAGAAVAAETFAAHG